MPTYEYSCGCGAMFDRVLRVKDYDQPQTCECGAIARKRISRPMVFVSQDICYDSPIDGRPITSKQARLDDLARSGCIPYEPGMKQDYQRRIAQDEARLDAKMEKTVEAEIERMPSDKRERLHAELLGGAEVVTERLTAPVKSSVTLAG